MNNNYSPLRYPGGKAVMSPFLKDFIKANNIHNVVYVEPYAGGAGAALNLLFTRQVDKIIIYDASIPIYSFWNSLINHSERFMNLFEQTEVNLEEWHKEKNIFINRHSQFSVELGFATFFLNRCNRSGILAAGPIGGRTIEKQSNAKYKIDARYIKDRLREKLIKVISHKDLIEVMNNDALFLLQQIDQLPQNEKKHYLIYLDPPYYEHGAELYLNSYTHNDHAELASFLLNRTTIKWVLSYDNVKEIRDLYKGNQLYTFDLSYSVQEKKQGKELLVTSKNTVLPSQLEIRGSKKIRPLTLL